jgi:hypothetical protein
MVYHYRRNGIVIPDTCAEQLSDKINSVTPEFVGTSELEYYYSHFTVLSICKYKLLKPVNIAICSKFPSSVTSLQLVTGCSNCGILARDTVYYFQWTQPFRQNQFSIIRV